MAEIDIIVDHYKSEIERLKGELEEEKRATSWAWRMQELEKQQVSRLRRENENLRKRVERYKDQPPAKVNKIIANALKLNGTSFEEIAHDRLGRAINAGWVAPFDYYQLYKQLLKDLTI